MKKIIILIVCTIVIAISAVIHIALFNTKKTHDLITNYNKEQHHADVAYALRDCEKLTSPETSTPAEALTKDQVLPWAEKAVIETMTFGHNFYKDQLKNSSRHFTKKGWESFTTALAQSRIIESIEANQQDIRSLSNDDVEQTIKREEDKWLVQIPIYTSYTQHNKTRTTKMMVTLYIVESDDPINESGIGIEQWVAIPSDE